MLAQNKMVCVDGLMKLQQVPFPCLAYFHFIQQAAERIRLTEGSQQHNTARK